MCWRYAELGKILGRPVIRWIARTGHPCRWNNPLDIAERTLKRLSMEYRMEWVPRLTGSDDYRRRERLSIEGRIELVRRLRWVENAIDLTRTLRSFAHWQRQMSARSRFDALFPLPAPFGSVSPIYPLVEMGDIVMAGIRTEWEFVESAFCDLLDGDGSLYEVRGSSRGQVIFLLRQRHPEWVSEDFHGSPYWQLELPLVSRKAIDISVWDTVRIWAENRGVEIQEVPPPMPDRG